MERTNNQGSMEELKHPIRNDFAAYQEHVRTKRLTDAAIQIDIKTKDCVVMQVDSVCAFINKLVDMIHLKDNEHFIIYSDGPRTEFKNKFITGKLLHDLSIKLGQPVFWKYFATGHGKGVVEKIGGSTKACVKEKVIGKGKGKTPVK